MEFICAPQRTLYSSVFASPSRVLYEFAAGRHATIPTLRLARGLGMEYSIQTMMGAAESNKLSVMKFLLDEGCAWSIFEVSSAAARSGDVQKLSWLLEHDCEWDCHHLGCAAVSSGSIEPMTWVTEHFSFDIILDADYDCSSTGRLHTHHPVPAHSAL
jgi:hypothetical protein